MNFLTVLIRHARREWRGAELRPVLLALVVAVASATGVLVFSERIERGLSARSGELIGGDAMLSSRLPIPPALVERAQADGLTTTAVVAFPTVLFAGDASVLVEVKAVHADYPLRGRLRIADELQGPERVAAAPVSGQIYLDPRAIAALNVKVGASLDVGNASLTVGGILTEDPEGAGSFLTLAPRVLVRVEDTEALGLLGPGSRAFHRLLIAGPDAQVKGFAAAVKDTLDGIRLTLAGDAEQQLAEVGRQARAFFGLAALAVLWMAALAIALTARRYTEARREIVAQLRCFGLSRRRILLQLGGTLGVYALPAIALGIGLGYLLQALIVIGVGALFQEALPPPGVRPALLGGLVGLLAYLSFTLPALSRLAGTAPSTLLRATEDRLGWREWAAYPIALAVLTGAIWLLTGEGRMGLIAFTAMSILALLLAGVIAALLRVIRWRTPGRSFIVRQALRQLAAHPGTTLLSSVSLAIALAAVLLLGVVSGDLVSQWRLGLSGETPNRFLLNIQPEQRDTLVARLAAAGVPAPKLFPIAVGRLIAINGAKPDSANFADPRAARSLDGTLNLSWSEELPEANRITSGEWWTPDGGGQVSVAENWATMFGLKVGDRLTVAIGDREIEARIASIRKVDWDSFRVNFFLLFEPQTVAGLDSSWVTSIRADATQARALGPILREFPNVTLIDVDAILSRILGVVDSVVRSLSAIFWCALAAAVCVLLAALAVSAGARRSESALWRSLGASRHTLRWTQNLELAAIGILGGGFGGAAALLTGQQLAGRVFNMPYSTPWWIAAAGAAAGVLLCLVAGWWVLRGVTETPPAQVLRE